MVEDRAQPPHPNPIPLGGEGANEPPRRRQNRDNDDILSLRHHLMNWLFTPLYLLLLFSTVTGYIAALKLANQPYDLVLIERARLMISRFDLALGDAAPAAADLLPDGASDLQFTVYDRADRAVAGNAALPRPRPADWTAAAARPRDTSLKGRKVRLLVLPFRSAHPGRGGDYILVLAEPVDERLALGRNILGNVVIPQFIFILIAGLAVWIGLRRGFEPLERLRRAVAARRGDDLRPLDEALAPGEVRPLIHEVNALIERLKAMMEQQKRFVANAAHQLRTPFAGLRAQAELARREEAPPAVRAALEGICEGAGRCSRLVNQLLTLARNEPGARQADEPGLLDLERVAQEAARQWVPEAMAKDIDLGFEGTGTHQPVRGVEHALRDLIDNLIDNAIRYTPAGGRITVRTGDDEGAWLKVEDNGPGIPVEERARVFDRFYRVAGSGQPGSGLGLAIVHEVAQRHRARVEIEAGEGGLGTVFSVRFPHDGA